MPRLSYDCDHVTSDDDVQHAIGLNEYFGENSSVPRTGTQAMQNKLLDFFTKNKGLLLVVLSQAFTSIMTASVKVLNGIDPSLSTVELVAVRMFITYVCCMVYMLAVGVPDPLLGPKGVRVLLVTRAFVGFVGLFGIYYPLRYLSLSDSTVLTFLTPLCTAMAGAALLGEKLTRREVFAGIVSLVGVILIARPDALFGGHSDIRVDIQVPQNGVISEGLTNYKAGASSSEKGTPGGRLIAVVVALIGVMGSTGAYVSIRAIGTRAETMHTMSIFFAFCVIISTIVMFVNKTPWIIPARLDWFVLLIIISISGFVSQMFLIMGLQRETAGRGSMAIYTQIIFATILERIFFSAIPTVLSVLGALLILSSALYISVSNMKENKISASPKPIRLSRLAADAEIEVLLHDLGT